MQANNFLTILPNNLHEFSKHENLLFYFRKFFFNIEQNNGQSSPLISYQKMNCSLLPACNSLVIDVIYRSEDLQCHEHRSGMTDI